MPAAHQVHPFEIGFYVHDDGTVPAEQFLDRCPDAVEDKLSAILTAVAESPPHRFSGGGMWEAMHGEMAGWYEVRCDHKRVHYRLFCLLDNPATAAQGLLVVVDGRSKQRGTKLSTSDYDRISKLGDRYWSTLPRPVV